MADTVVRLTGKKLGKPRYTTHDTVTVLQWRGYTPGARVVLRDMDTRLPISGRFEFVSYQVNMRSGRAWVNLYGGPARHLKVRSYHPSQVLRKRS